MVTQTEILGNREDMSTWISFLDLGTELKSELPSEHHQRDHWRPLETTGEKGWLAQKLRTQNKLCAFSSAVPDWSEGQ